MGVISIYRDTASDNTAISNIFIDEYMKDANDAQLKIYLYLMRMMSSGRKTSIGEMADLFNYTEKDVVRALRYWEQKGLLMLQLDGNGILTGIRLCMPHQSAVPARGEHEVISITSSSLGGPVRSTEPPQPEKAAASSKEAPESAAPVVSGHAGISAAQLEEFQNCEHSRQLLLIVEQYIGKPLSVVEAGTIYYISEQLHFSDDLIDYLVEYCVGLGKKDFRYIEKVAVNWAEEGITTTGQAQKAVSSGARARRRSEKSSGKKRGRTAGFADFENNSYDFAEIERKLLQQ